MHRTFRDCHRIGLVVFLQCFNIVHQTSSPNHPRSNGFVEHMVGVAKMLMDKAGKERKPWISGLLEYRMTPQTGSIASSLQLMTQHRPKETHLPQLPSALGAQQMHQVHQELINKARKQALKEVPRVAARHTSLGSK